MKKAISAAFLLACVLMLSACGQTLHGTDDLIEQAREVIPISDAESIDIQYAGMCGKDDDALIWFVSGNEYQAHYYLPMECAVVGQNEYTYTNSK